MPSADYKVEIVDSSGEADMTVAVIGDQVVDLTGATDGQVLTIQSDGTVAPENPGIPGAHAATHASAGSDPVTLAQSQITDLTADLALKAPLASPTFTGTVNLSDLTATGAILIANGTNAAPSLAFASDADGSGTGFYRTGTNTIGVSCGGARKFQIGTSALTIDDTFNIALGTSTGTKIGTGITQLLGFYNAAPIAQRAGAAQAAVPTTGAALASFGYTTAAQADAIVTLVNELRAWAVAQGFIKGSA